MKYELNRWWARTQMTQSVRLRLYRKMAKMLSNGLPLLKILEELRKRASSGKTKSTDPMAIMLDECRHMVQNGEMLSQGLAWWVPRNEQMIIMAGEQSGHLDKSLIAVIGVAQASRKIKAAILAGVLYPAAVGILILAYIYLFGTRVIPQFARLVDPNAWTGAAKSLYLMSLFVQHYLVYAVLAIVAVVTAVFVSFPRWRGRARVVADRFAPFSIYRLVMGSGFLMALSALLSAGVTMEKSLVRMSNFAEPWLRERIDGTLLGVKSGLNCGEALRNSGYGFPSREIIDDLCIYADYQGFAEALKILAEEWMEEGGELIGLHMRFLNGVSILLLAFVIGWLVTGFFGIQHEISSMTRAIR